MLRPNLRQLIVNEGAFISAENPLPDIDKEVERVPDVFLHVKLDLLAECRHLVKAFDLHKEKQEQQPSSRFHYKTETADSRIKLIMSS